MSVFDFLKGNNFVPFPPSHVQSFAKQMLESIACTFPSPYLSERLLSISLTLNKFGTYRFEAGEHPPRRQ
jgi:hypothetical protein